MVTSREIMPKIREILLEVADDDTLSKRLTGNTNINTDIGLDSIRMINLILILEDEFGIEINFEKFSLDNLNSVDILCSFIADLKNSASSASAAI